MNNIFKDISVQKKLFALCLFFVVTFASAIVYTVTTLQQQEHDAIVTSIAGRERMLIQKFTKEVMLELNQREVINAALVLAATASQQITAGRAYYTKNIVGKLKREWPDFKASENYHDMKGAIPLPATFVKEMSAALSNEIGFHPRLLSKWAINKNRGLKTEFEKRAWHRLEMKSSDESYYEKRKADQGAVLDYATKDIALSSCVSCHNSHHGSSKTNWKSGDLMGILVSSTLITSDPVMAANILNSDRIPMYEKTAKLFEISLKSLRRGGKTYADLNMLQEITIPANQDAEIEAKLAEVALVWNQLQQAVTISLREKVNSPRFLAQVSLIRSLNLDALSRMHSAVNMVAENSRNRVYSMQNTEWLILFFTMLFGGYFCIWIGRGIVRPLHSAVAVVGDFAEGDLTRRIDVSGQDEIGQLATAFNIMADKIGKYHEKIRAKNNELKAYGEQLEQRVEERTATLAAANKEIKSFAYIVSHDLRSPLVNIKGFTGELSYTLQEITKKIAPVRSGLNESDRHDMQRLIEEDIPESMQFISTSVEKMDHMLSAILTLSRLGQRQLKIEPVDLYALCDGVLASLSYQIAQSQTETTLGHLPVIENDRMVMEQIMANLIGNAVKYLNPDRSGKIEISSEISDTGITITVCDNGHGILPQEEEKVFQIFRRGVHQDVEGEGMGLPYVQTLVRAQGGNISFKPAPDCGTIFSVFIPFQNKETIV